jgi:hypothetical protein
VRHEAAIVDDGRMSEQGYKETRERVLERLRAHGSDGARWDEAAALLDLLVLGDYQDFLTLPGYKLLS